MSRYIFGPVPSRRLGFSLGVDVVPLKTCTLSCLYCQLGVTAGRTIVRREYVPRAEVLEEIRQFAAGGQTFDFVTFSGSGEPTLHRGLGAMIAGAKEISGKPVAVITNGTLLNLPAVRRDLARADIVLPSLDAGGGPVYRAVNRPHPRLKFDDLVSGLVSFRREYPGRIWLEVMLVRGINDSPAELAAIRRIIAGCRPDRVQLNTVVRPPADSTARPLSREEMEAAAAFLGGNAEIIAEFARSAAGPGITGEKEKTILAALARRPLTVADLCSSFGLGASETERLLRRLVKTRLVRAEEADGKTYYRAEVKHRPGS